MDISAQHGAASSREIVGAADQGQPQGRTRRVSRLARVAGVAAAAAGLIVPTFGASVAQAREVDPSIPAPLIKKKLVPTDSGVSAARAMAPKISARPAATPAAGVPMPADCSVLTTIVRPDRTLAYGIVIGNDGAMVQAGAKLSFDAAAVTYVNVTGPANRHYRHFLVASTAGQLYHVVVTERTTDQGLSYSASSTKIGARGWQLINTMTTNYPYVYATNRAGALIRYSLNSSYSVSATKVLAAATWGKVSSLSRGAMWEAGTDENGVKHYAEDIVALSSDGKVAGYVVPRTYTGKIAGFVLRPAGWASGFSHASVGGCASSAARPLAFTKPNGDVSLFVDKNGDDENGDDFRWSNYPAKGWVGVLGD